MKLKKKALNQGLLKKFLRLNSFFIIFCLSDLTFGLEYKYKRLCKNNFKLPDLLFSFNYDSQVQNFILCKENLFLVVTFLKINYYKFKNYGFTFLYFNSFYFKEFSIVQLYFFESKKLLNFFKNILVIKEKLSSSNGKDIALSR